MEDNAKFIDLIGRFVYVYIILLIAISGLCVDGASGMAQVYRPVMVSASTLSKATVNETYSAISATHCAIRANTRDWTKLMCFEDSKCDLYDVNVTKNHVDDNEDVQKCFTKLDKECVVKDQVLEHGQTTVINCTRMVCNDSSLNLFASADEKFHYYGPGVGCVYISNELASWNNARAICKSEGGDLLVTDNFTLFQDFMAEHTESFYYIVGVRNNKWLDGRDVAVNEWESGDPDYKDQCGYSTYRNNHLLFDAPCTDNRRFLCQFT